MIDLDRIEALANAATPGPWAPSEQTRGGPVTSAWVESLPADTIVVDSRGTAFAFGVNVCAVPPFDVDKAAADTAFIAAARTDVPALVAELRAARAEIERLRTAAADERADVVAFLTQQWAEADAKRRGSDYYRGSADALDEAGSSIVRGAHVGAAKGGERG